MNGRPHARVLDMALCVGPLDFIAQGSSLVLAAGLPSSRRGDRTAHGGSISTGSSDIEVGGAAVRLNASGDAAFVAQLQEALAKLLPTRSGCQWLQQMAANGRTVTFQATADDNGYCSAVDAGSALRGVGSDSVIEWNPSHHVVDPALPGRQGTPGSLVILAHELVAALHNGNGNHRGNIPTENSFRDDLGIPRRPSYYPSGWPGGAPW